MLQIKARQPAVWVALYQSETYFKIFISFKKVRLPINAILLNRSKEVRVVEMSET